MRATECLEAVKALSEKQGADLRYGVEVHKVKFWLRVNRLREKRMEMDTGSRLVMGVSGPRR